MCGCGGRRELTTAESAPALARSTLLCGPPLAGSTERARLAASHPRARAHVALPCAHLLRDAAGAGVRHPCFSIQDQKPHLRWLAVFGWCTPTVRQNVSEVLPDAVLPPGFRPRIVPRGYVLGSPRLCHTSASGDSLDVRVGEVLRVLKSCDADADLSKDLCRFADEIDGDVVLKVLQKKRSNWQVALLFFTWAAGLPMYEHGPRTYIEMLDILGRMKKVRLMRQLFDEIPEQRRGLVATNMMFVVLLKRYARAHKVQEAIEIFYKINNYEFEVDLVGFQILLMLLCRYKHVEEDEALFL
ncbi:putative pentatricopeptide repeat-containing protein [Hordeum vulgare]|nr:putative pentatricopeptide repeat-containing protein [Hordeum vulgare]